MNVMQTSYSAMWAEAVNDQEGVAKADQRTQEHWESKASRLGFGIYKARCFCERLTREYDSPWFQPSEVESGRLYLINKHHWHPEQVKGLNLIHLMTLLHAELVEMKLTEKEWEPVRNWTAQMSCYSALAKSAGQD